MLTDVCSCAPYHPHVAACTASCIAIGLAAATFTSAVCRRTPTPPAAQDNPRQPGTSIHTSVDSALNRSNVTNRKCSFSITCNRNAHRWHQLLCCKVAHQLQSYATPKIRQLLLSIMMGQGASDQPTTPLVVVAAQAIATAQSGPHAALYS